jgi:hypothetical protein
MTSPQRGAASLFSLLVLVGVLSGCAMMRRNMGIRPPEPEITESVDCGAYKTYAKYAQELQEAYHSRATQNRGWLYVAGILGLGVAAASGGLAVATTVGAGTLGLLSISGGFAGASFATINNEALAASYTTAANSIDTALKDSRAVLPNCASALSILVINVSNARTHLEAVRTDNAALALARAADQRKLLDKQIAAIRSADLTTETFTAEIVNVDPLAPAAAGAATVVKITVKNIKLDRLGLDDVKVVFGTKELRVDSIEKDAARATFGVKFTPPATKPDETKDYLPALLLEGKTVVPANATKIFKYP